MVFSKVVLTSTVSYLETWKSEMENNYLSCSNVLCSLSENQVRTRFIQRCIYTRQVFCLVFSNNTKYFFIISVLCVKLWMTYSCFGKSSKIFSLKFQVFSSILCFSHSQLFTLPLAFSCLFFMIGIREKG